MLAVRALIVILMVGPLLVGCAPRLSSDTYDRYQVRSVQTVQLGVVDRVRPVLIEGTKSEIGAGAGAVAGGVAGSHVGGGSGRIVGAIGGAVIGGLMGAATEEAITRRQGLEITVRMDDGRYLAVVQETHEAFYPGERVRVLTGYDGTARISH